MSSSDTYLVAATTVTPGPTSSLTRSYRERTSSGDKRQSSLPPGAGAVPAVREEELWMTGRTQIRAHNAYGSSLPKRPLGGGPEIEVGGAQDSLAKARPERLSHLFARL